MPFDGRATIQNHLAAGARAFATAQTDESLLEKAARAAEVIDAAFKRGRKLYIAGNGGSAADAQHMAAELVGYFSSKADKPRPALALTTDTSFLTAWGNDEDFNNIFKRQLQAHASRGDVFFGISTSGKSPDILRGLETAHDIGLYRIGLLGPGGPATGLCDVAIHMPVEGTPYIQELHIAVIHAICKCIDRK